MSFKHVSVRCMSSPLPPLNDRHFTTPSDRTTYAVYPVLAYADDVTIFFAEPAAFADIQQAIQRCEEPRQHS